MTKQQQYNEENKDINSQNTLSTNFAQQNKIQ